MRGLAVILLSLLPVQAAMACTPMVPDDRTPAQARAEGMRVSVDRQCRMVNGGIHDTLSLGPVSDLGNGRVMQRINDDASLALLADCGTREATILIGRMNTPLENPCGGATYPPRPIAEMVDLGSGPDLGDLVSRATAAGAFERNPLEFFFTFELYGQGRFDVARRDRFDLLCGCGLYYPDSPGASG